MGGQIIGSHGEHGLDAWWAQHISDVMLVEDLEGHCTGALDGNRLWWLNWGAGGGRKLTVAAGVCNNDQGEGYDIIFLEEFWLKEEVDGTQLIIEMGKCIELGLHESQHIVEMGKFLF